MRLARTSCQTIEAYIQTFIEEYPTAYNDKCIVGLFLKLLNKKGMTVSAQDLWYRITSTQKRLELESFEKNLSSGAVNPISRLQNLDGVEFEQYLQELFSKMGYNALLTQSSGDQGADLVLEGHGEKIVVQAKKWTNKVDNSAVQEVSAAIRHYGANRGKVVTTSVFTQGAIELARSNNIELIDGNALNNLLLRYM